MNLLALFRSFAMVSVVTSSLMVATNFVLSLYLPKELFGELSYFSSIYLLAGNLLPFGSNLAIYVYRYSIKYDEYSTKVMEFLFLIVPTVFVGLLLILLILNYIFSVEQTYFMVFTASFLSAFILGVAHYFSASQRMLPYALIMITYSIVVVVCYSYGTLINREIMYVYIYLFVANLVFALIAIKLLINELDYKFEVKGVLVRFNKSFTYGATVAVSSLAMSFLVLGDKVLSKKVLGDETFGLYAIAAMISSTTMFLVNNFASAWGAFLAKKLADMDARYVCSFYKSGQKYLLILPLVCLGLSVGQIIICRFFYLDFFEELWQVVIVLTSAYLMYASSKYYIGFLNYYHKNYLVFMSAFLGLLAMSLLILNVGDQGLRFVSLSVLIGFLVQLSFCKVSADVVLSRRLALG